MSGLTRTRALSAMGALHPFARYGGREDRAPIQIGGAVLPGRPDLLAGHAPATPSA